MSESSKAGVQWGQMHPHYFVLFCFVSQGLWPIIWWFIKFRKKYLSSSDTSQNSSPWKKQKIFSVYQFISFEFTHLYKDQWMHLLYWFFYLFSNSRALSLFRASFNLCLKERWTFLLHELWGQWSFQILPSALKILKNCYDLLAFPRGYLIDEVNDSTDF